MNAKPIVTITSEYGQNSPYTAVIKGLLLAEHSEMNIVDISHNVLPNDILAASYLIKTTAQHFAPNTIHLIAVDVNVVKYQNILIARSNNQYFVGADNGIFSLLFKDKDADFFIVNNEWLHADEIFPEKTIFPKIVSHLIQQKPLHEIASTGKITTIRETLTPSVENNILKGSIIFIDGYQNVITDISKTDFEKMLAKWKNFEILYRGKSRIKSISKNYEEEKNGEVLALFNSFDLLEIALKQGKAQSLLGLNVGAHILIEFYD